VLAKTAQKHDYPSAARRRSYARRTGAERGFPAIKDPAASDIARGWCRLMGLAPLMLFTTTLLIVRNQRALAAGTARQEENQRRASKGLPPKTRKRRRKTLAGLAAGPPRPASRDHQPRARHHSHHQAKACPSTHGKPGHPAPQRDPKTRHHATGHRQAKMSQANVKLGPTET
jgi:hypothetical protein